MFVLFNSTPDLRAHSADRHETLTHDPHLGALYNPSPKIWGLSPTKFRGPKTCEIWRGFTQLPTLIDNISGTRQDIQNRKDVISSDSSYVQPNKSGELWSTIHKVVNVSLDPTKSTFSKDYISAPRGCWLLKFLHALEFDQAMVAHIAIGVGVRIKILRANI